MRLGVNVPNFGPGTTVETMDRWAQVIDGLGFDLLMMSDHVLITPDVARAFPGPFHDPFTTLAWLAGRHPRLTLGTTVLIVPYRPAAATAQLAAGLHRLTGGRFVLGAGVGWARQEFQALGVPFEKRGEVTDDHLREMRRIWTGEADGVQAALTPQEQPGPPVWIGGSTAPAMRRTVSLGDGWHPMRNTIPELRSGLKRIAELADTAGKPTPTFEPRLKFRLTDAPVPQEQQLPGIGTLRQVLADLEELQTMGAGSVLLDPYHGDPAETLRPETAWRDLGLVAEAWARRG